MPRARWEALAKKRAKRGLKTGRFSAKPELRRDLVFGWDGWSELALSRPYKPDGYPLGILHTELQAWLDLNCIVYYGRRLDLYHTIKVIDIAWLAEIKAKRDGAEPPESPDKPDKPKGLTRGNAKGRLRR